jgi:hypothetical protein
MSSQQNRPRNESTETGQPPRLNFNVETALNYPKFTSFLAKIDGVEDLDPNDPSYPEIIERHFSAFKGADDVKKVIVKTLKDKFKAETGIVLADSDFDSIADEIDREALENPELLAEKLSIVKAYNELPEEIRKTEQEIARLGGVDALVEKRDQLTERQKVLELASEVSFLDRVTGLDEGVLTERGFVRAFEERLGSDENLRVLDVFKQLQSLGDVSDRKSDIRTFVRFLKDKQAQPQYVYDFFVDSKWKAEDIDRPTFASAVNRIISVFEQLEEEAEQIREKSEQKEAFEKIQEEKLAGKSLAGKVAVKFRMSKLVAEDLKKVNSELAKVEASARKAEQLTELLKQSKEEHGKARQGVLKVYSGIQNLSVIVKGKIEESFKKINEDANKAGLRPEQRIKKLEEARRMIANIRTDDDTEYVENADGKRAEIQTAIEDVLIEEAETIFDKIGNGNEGGALGKTLMLITNFISRRGSAVGEKTGDEAGQFLIGVVREQAGKATGAKKILITNALAKLRI